TSRARTADRVATRLPRGTVSLRTHAHSLARSMGPPLFRGGHDAFQAHRRVIVLLQWGHLSLEVVMPAGCLRDTPPRRLQWGHLSLEVVIPSMLPSFLAKHLLQWGHLSLEVVIATELAVLAAGSVLQW